MALACAVAFSLGALPSVRLPPSEKKKRLLLDKEKLSEQILASFKLSLRFWGYPI